MPQIATVGLVSRFRDDGGIGTQEEPAVFRRKTRAFRVLRDSGPVKRKGWSLPVIVRELAVRLFLCPGAISSHERPALPGSGLRLDFPTHPARLEDRLADGGLLFLSPSASGAC